MSEEQQKPLQRHRECGLPPMPDPTDWQTRALAAEVALELRRDAAVRHLDLDFNHEAGLIPPRTQGFIRGVARDHPDLADARELMRKAGAHDLTVTTLGEGTDGEDAYSIAGMLFGKASFYEEELEKCKAENAGLAALVGELRAALEAAIMDMACCTDPSRHESMIRRCREVYKSPLPEAAKRAAAERAFCDAALAFADAKASIEEQAAEYKRTLAALQDARRSV